MALLGLGTATLSQLSQTTGISRSNLYPVLDSLQGGVLLDAIQAGTPYRPARPPAEVLAVLEADESARLAAAGHALQHRLQEARDVLAELPAPAQRAASAITVVDVVVPRGKRVTVTQVAARTRHRHDGFTLIELLVVIVILGVLRSGRRTSPRPSARGACRRTWRWRHPCRLPLGWRTQRQSHYAEDMDELVNTPRDGAGGRLGKGFLSEVSTYNHTIV